MTTLLTPSYGLALINKPPQKTSFYLVHFLRKLTKVKCIGHAGTLDPFATGLMLLLVGKPYTKKTPQLIGLDKEYVATLKLGETTDSYDLDGSLLITSSLRPEPAQINEVLKNFQGETFQKPPMFSAKKIKGQKLYHLARKGIEVERAAKKVYISVEFLEYAYPFLKIQVRCSSGTYIRALAHDMGQALGCGAHLVELTRTKVGLFDIKDCQALDDLNSSNDLILKETW